QLFLFFYALISSGDVPPPRTGSKSLDRLKEILKYVEIRYNEKIPISDAARICGFSESHFMKFFRSSMGISFTDYLNEYRLTMAARMLLSSSDSIAAIAGETGFENLSYFNRRFKKKYGCTPSEFRSGTSV
ncbi:MAG: helix-turn-helix transcriptional regulator, partial [Lachnospiraceae bacterium]|nr:helix-turn-helix transcriptional regulator [Lachnospiraceae bacterium]